MPSKLYTGTKMVTEVIIRDLEDSGNLIVVPSPSEVNFNQGIEMEETMGVSPLGEMVTVDMQPQQRNPEIVMTFPKKSPATLGMKMGYRMEEVTGMQAALRRNGVQVDRTSFAAATDGKEGFGIVADQEDATASYLKDNGISAPLTLETFAGFDPVTATLSFAVGDNGALSFSEDLIGKFVSYEIPYILTEGVMMTENLFNRFKPTIVVIQNDLKIMAWEYPEAIIDQSNGDINFNESQVEITMRIIYNGIGCLPVKVKYLGQARLCQDA